MLPCDTCTSRRTLPWHTHIACVAPWGAEPLPTLVRDAPMSVQEQRSMTHGHQHGWFDFPDVFDPVWGPNHCSRFAANA